MDSATSLKGDAKVRVCVKLDEKYKNQEVTLAVLSKERDMAALDLYVNCTQEVSLMLVGAPKGTEVSLSGYFEPKGDDMDDDMFGYGNEQDEDGDDMEDDEDSDEEPAAAVKNTKGLVVQGKAIPKQVATKALTDSLSQAKQNANKNASSTAVHDEDLDSDDEDDDEEPSKEEAEDSDDDEDDDDSEEDVKPVVVSAKKVSKQPVAKVVEDSDSDDEEEEDEDDKLVDLDSDSDDGEEVDLEKVM